MPGPSNRAPRGWVGIISAELRFPEAGSLKSKRTHLRRMRDTLTRRHGASFAEVGYQDLWQRAQVLVAVCASDLKVLESSLGTAVHFLDSQEWELISASEEVIEVDA